MNLLFVHTHTHTYELFPRYSPEVTVMNFQESECLSQMCSYVESSYWLKILTKHMS